MLKLVRLGYNYLYVGLNYTNESIRSYLFIIYLLTIRLKSIKKLINQSDTILMLGLSKAQIDGFKNILTDKKFSKKFSIPLIRDANFIILQSKIIFYKEINNKTLIGVPYLNLIFGAFSLIILKYQLRELLRMSLAERINMYATKIKVDVFVTNSNLGRYHKSFSLIPVKKFVTHCLHYSENSLPVGLGEPLKDSYVRWIGEEPSDFQWVWSEEYAEYIRKVNPKTKVNVVGFVGFDYLPAQPMFKIAVFDVTPAKPGVLEDVHPLHQFDNAKKFISDIVKIQEKINRDTSSMQVVVDIKPKRRYLKIHSVKYINFVEDLHQKGKVTLKHFSTNPYDLLLNVDLLICVPFTTAAQFGEIMGVPTIYYNYLDKKIYSPISHPVELIQNYQDLLIYVSALFNKKLYNLNK